MDVAAPGVSVFSTFLPFVHLTSTCHDDDGDGYGYCSGTSMATAHVSGVAALILAQAPLYTGDEVKSNILMTVDHLASLEGLVLTRGRINISKQQQPTLLAISPTSIACSYLDQSGGTGIHWSVLKIYGWNFGPEQGSGSVVVGPPSWYLAPGADPLNSTYFEQPFVIWANDLILVGFGLPEPWEKYLPPAAAQSRTGAVWVRKDGQYTDPLPLRIEYCDIIR